MAKAKTSESAELTAEAILGADDLPSIRVEVPEWGGHLFVRSMTAGERDLWEAWLLDSDEARGKGEKVDTIRATLVALTAVNGAGERMFTAEQMPALAKKSAKAMDRVFERARALNAMSAADIEELEKN